MIRKWMYVQDISPFKAGDMILADEKMHIISEDFENSNYKYFLTTLSNMRIDIYEYIIPVDIWRDRRINEILE